MEEQQKIKHHERFYFSTLNGVEAFIEVDWNDAACKDDMVKIVVKGQTAIIRKEDLETYLLALTKNPHRYMKSSTRKVGIKYVPVPQRLYQEYQEYKKAKEKGRSRIHKPFY